LNPTENSIEFFLNTHLEWSLSHQGFAITTTPFKANYGQDPRMGFEGRKKGKYVGAEKFVEKMKEIQEEAKAALKKA